MIFELQGGLEQINRAICIWLAFLHVTISIAWKYYWRGVVILRVNSASITQHINNLQLWNVLTKLNTLYSNVFTLLVRCVYTIPQY